MRVLKIFDPGVSGAVVSLLRFICLLAALWVVTVLGNIFQVTHPCLNLSEADLNLVAPFPFRLILRRNEVETLCQLLGISSGPVSPKAFNVLRLVETLNLLSCGDKQRGS